MNVPKTIVPPIKCQGIKTKLVPWIRQAVPADFGGSGTWIEPFMGSGVVAFNLRPKRALLADSNPHIIRFYKAVAEGEITPASARRFLETEGDALRRSDGGRYYEIRDRFNALGDPLDFLFLNRACFNGLIRFNRKGEFNVPFCRKPDRFAKPYVTKIANQIQAVADILRAGDYRLERQDFSAAIATARDGDFIYCDPPYAGRHADYFNDWDAERERRLACQLRHPQKRRRPCSRTRQPTRARAGGRLDARNAAHSARVNRGVPYALYPRLKTASSRFRTMELADGGY